jgi:tetraacyldisaccharide 4'-kinase
MKKWLSESWYKPHAIRWLLSPLSGLYRLVSFVRKQCYFLGLLKQHRVPVPVIIVGNISVGGTGKTPFVIYLIQRLQQQGFKPGVISRGYGGHSDNYPITVSNNSDPAIVGDEPVIIARQTNCPVVVSPTRVSAASFLLEHNDCDLIVSDDGLQHYALARDIEIVLVDEQRQFGNQYCLPAGPLREPLSRLQDVDFIVYNGGSNDTAFNMSLSASDAVNLSDFNVTKSIADFQGQEVHAIAGIGNPKRFFNQLTQMGIYVIPHEFADHHVFVKQDLEFNDNKTILMTEKDAVKCQFFAKNEMWFIPVETTVSGNLDQLIIQQLTGSHPHG